jgi:hypothetical protein
MSVLQKNDAVWGAEIDPRLELIAKRVLWWKEPAESLSNKSDFLCRVMALGLSEDVTYVLEIFGEQALRSALDKAPTGVFDLKSWSYWHLRFGCSEVPALPRREFVPKPGERWIAENLGP